MAADHPADSPLGRLERISDAADQLRARDWITSHDHLAITERAQRLAELTLADQNSVSFGGRESPVVRDEIRQLHTTVLQLLDASIDSAAIAPGDADLDARLQHHLDVCPAAGKPSASWKDGQTGWASPKGCNSREPNRGRSHEMPRSR